MQNTTFLGAAAKIYAEHLGLRVFPLYDMADGQCSCGNEETCSGGGKHPRIVGWQKEATTVAAKVRGWWKKNPNANIGIATGEKSGLFVIDADTQEGLDKLEELIGELPTPTTHSGQGMPHFWFRFPQGADITNRRGGLPEGIDIRANGGYIVAPPSVSHKGPYKFNPPESFVHNIELIEPSEKLLKLVEPSLEESLLLPPSKVGKFERLSKTKQERWQKYWDKAHEDEIAKVADLGPSDTGKWNITLYNSARRLFELAKTRWTPEIDFEEVKEELLEVCAPKYDKERWTKAICSASIMSAYDIVMRDDKMIPEPTSTTEKPEEEVAIRPKLIITKLSEARAPVMNDWLLDNFIPEKGLVVVAGYRSSGKSTWYTRIAADLSNGSLGSKPVKSIYLTSEENVYDLVRPRLELSQADLNNVFTVETEWETNLGNKGKGLPTFKRNLDDLYEIVKDTKAGAIFLDPAVAFLGINDSLNDSGDIRDRLTDLMNFCDSENVLIFGMKHFKKKQGFPNALSGLDLVSGSAEWGNVPRHVLNVWRANDELKDKLGLELDDTADMLLAIGKNSNGDDTCPPLAYSRVVKDYGFSNGKTGPIATFKADGNRPSINPADISVKEQQSPEEASRTVSRSGQTREFVIELVEEHGGSIPKKLLETKLSLANLGSMKTVDRNYESWGLGLRPIEGTKRNEKEFYLSNSIGDFPA